MSGESVDATQQGSVVVGGLEVNGAQLAKESETEVRKYLGNPDAHAKKKLEGVLDAIVPQEEHKAGKGAKVAKEDLETVEEGSEHYEFVQWLSDKVQMYDKDGSGFLETKDLKVAINHFYEFKQHQLKAMETFENEKAEKAQAEAEWLDMNPAERAKKKAKDAAEAQERQRSKKYQQRLQLMPSVRKERENFENAEENSFTYCADLKHQQITEDKEADAMFKEQEYTREILEAGIGLLFTKYKENPLMLASEQHRIALRAVQSFTRRWEETQKHLDTMEAASSDLDLGAHARVFKVLKEEYTRKGLPGLYTKMDPPSTEENPVLPKIAEAQPLRRLPPDRNNLGQFKKYIYKGAVPSRRLNHLDEGFKFEKPTVEAEVSHSHSLLKPKINWYEYAPVHITGVEIELAVSPAELDPAKQKAFLAELGRLVHVDPSFFHVRSLSKKKADPHLAYLQPEQEAGDDKELTEDENREMKGREHELEKERAALEKEKADAAFLESIRKQEIAWNAWDKPGQA